MKKQINKAAKAYALKVLGEEQFKTNKTAVKSICTDFICGIEWYIDAVKSNLPKK